MKKTNVFKALIIVATVFVGLTFIQCGVSDNKLKEVAANVNESLGCPVTFEGVVSLDSVYAAPGKELRFSYSFLIITKEEMDEVMSKAEFDQSLRAELLGMINQNTAEMKNVRATKATFVMEYYDKNGEFYTEVKVGPKEY